MSSSRKQSQDVKARRAAQAAGAAGRVLVRHPVLATTAPAAAGVVWLWGPWALAAVVLAAVGVLVAWWSRHPSSFRRLVADRARSAWRREWVYARRWRRTMFLCGLAAFFDGEEVVPRMGRVSCSWSTDVVGVREPLGQEPPDWEHRASALAESFGARSCRVRRVRPGRVELVFVTRRRDKVVGPLPVPTVEQLDLDAVPIGRRGDGEVWGLPLFERNIEIVGSAGSGKTEGFLGSLIRGLASWIAAGQVAIWAGDPKGGTGLAHGDLDADGEPACPLFARFERDELGVCQMVVDLVAEMFRREDRMRRAGARRWEPTPESPLVVLMVDELLSVTSLLADREAAREVEAALRLLLSRARASGIVVVACTQDPRERAVPFADFFQVKICARVARAALVDVVLGTGAHAAGAHADRIPTGDAGAGQAYVVSEEDGDGGAPIWVRASRVTRQVADDMGETWPSPWSWDDTQGVMVRHIPTSSGAEVVDITGRLPALKPATPAQTAKEAG